MNSERMERLSETTGEELRSKFEVLKEHAEHFADQAINKMVDDGHVIELTDDEERMLRAYRGFQTRTMPGATFSWTTPVEDTGIVVCSEARLVIDPREANAL